MVDLVDLSPEELEKRRSWVAAVDLAKVFTNWGDGYCRLLDERQEADYSLVNDFCTEVMEHAVMYMARLLAEEILQSDGLAYVREVLNAQTLRVIDTCVQYEDLQRLTGRWSDTDQETKEYWLKSVAITSKLLGFAGPKPIKEIAER